MNSRKAQNEISPNSTIVATVEALPSKNAEASTVHISHQARIRELNVCTTAGFTPMSACRLRNCATMVATAKSPSTRPIRLNVCGGKSIVLFRSNLKTADFRFWILDYEEGGAASAYGNPKRQRGRPRQHALARASGYCTQKQIRLGNPKSKSKIPFTHLASGPQHHALA